MKLIIRQYGVHTSTVVNNLGLARPVRQVWFWPYHFFGHLTISRRELYSQGGVATTWWHSIDLNVRSTCIQFETASCSRFVVLELPRQLSAGFIVSLRCGLLLFYHGWHGKQKSVTVQCKARWYYESPSRQQKNEGEKIFPCFARRDGTSVSLYTAFGSGRTTPKYLAPAL